MRAETFSATSAAVSLALAVLGRAVGPTSSALVPILMTSGGTLALAFVGAWIATGANKKGYRWNRTS